MTDDDLDPVARLGSDAPFDAATDARVRSKVLGLLAEDGVEPPEGFVEGADDVVVDLGAPTPARQQARSRWGLRTALAAAVAAVLVVVGIGLVSGGDDLPSAADFADAAREGPYTTIGEGEQLVIVQEHEGGGGLIDERSEKRIGPDGAGSEQVDNRQAGRESTNDYGPGELAVGGIPYPALADLPTDPDQLVVAVREIAQISDEGTSWALLDLASTTATPPAVRGAAVDALIQRVARTEAIDDDVALVVDQADGSRQVATLDLDQGVITTLEVYEPGAEVPTDRFRFLGTTVEPA